MPLLPALLFAASLLPGQAAAPPAPPVPPAVTAPVEDPRVTALARTIYGQMRAGKVDATLLTPAMQEGLSPGKMAEMKPVFEQLGDPVTLKLEEKATSEAGTAWQYLATFPTAQLHVRIFVTPEGKVGGYVLAP